MLVTLTGAIVESSQDTPAEHVNKQQWPVTGHSLDALLLAQPPVPSPPLAPHLPHFGESEALWTCSPGVICTSSYLPSPSFKPLRLCSAGPLFLQLHLSVPLGNNKDHDPAPNLGLPPLTGAPGCLLLRTQPTASFPPGHLPWATSPSWTALPL